MLRRIFAVVAGLAVAVIVVMLIQKLGHNLYPPPEDLDPADKEFMRNYMANLPWGPLAFVAASYTFATLIGGWVAAMITKDKPLLYAAMVGAAVMVGAISSVMTTPHPTWFTTASVVGIVVAVLLAAIVAANSGTYRKIY